MNLNCFRFFSFEDYQQAFKDVSKGLQLYPFQYPWYQQVFVDHFGDEQQIYWLGIREKEELVAMGAFEVVDDTAVFVGMKPVLGKEEVTDYGDIIFNDQFRMTHDESENEKKEMKGESDGLRVTSYKKAWESIQTYFKEIKVKKLQLDYVRKDSPTYQWFSQLAINNLPAGKAGQQLSIAKQEVSPYITLPTIWDEYLSGMERKKRKELRRKIRRLEKEQAFYVCDESNIERDFDDFIRLHRLSDPAKNQFMSEDMKQFFWKTITACQLPWEPKLCFLKIDEHNVASVLTFVNDKQVLFYNSGYDLSFNYYSVGLLLKAFLVKQAIKDGKHIADWLRGNERYKYDLASTDMNLYQISFTF